MGFVRTENYEKDVSAWNGEWLSFRGVMTLKEDMLLEIAAEKRVSLNMLKKAIPEKFIGKTDILEMKVSEDNVIIDRGEYKIAGRAEFIEKREFRIRKTGERYEILDNDSNVMFSYFAYQSKYHAEDSFYMYTYVLKDKSDTPVLYLSLTDVDRNTEGSRGSSIHAFVSMQKAGLDDRRNMCTFVLCDSAEQSVFRGLFGL